MSETRDPIQAAAEAAYHRFHDWTGPHDCTPHWRAAVRAAVAAYLRAEAKNHRHSSWMFDAKLEALADELDATPRPASPSEKIGMTSSDLPVSLRQGSFTLFGVEVSCHVLDDGQRVIDAESMGKLLVALANPDTPSASAEDLRCFVEFVSGR
jgi:hypothetical protein